MTTGDSEQSQRLDSYMDADFAQETLPGDAPAAIGFGNPNTFYADWELPDTIIADVSGLVAVSETQRDLKTAFTNHLDSWLGAATPATTLWLVVPEHNWPFLHTFLTRLGWRHQTCLTWRRPPGYISSSTPTDVTSLCIRYTLQPEFPVSPGAFTATEWVRHEWKRTGISVTVAEAKCDTEFPIDEFLSGSLEQCPPFSVVEQLSKIAAEYGDSSESPFFEFPTGVSWSSDGWDSLCPMFECDADETTLWDMTIDPEKQRLPDQWGVDSTVPPQAPVEGWRRLIQFTTEPEDTVWVPFAGVGGALVAAKEQGRYAKGATAVRDVYRVASSRVSDAVFGRGIDNTQASFEQF